LRRGSLIEWLAAGAGSGRRRCLDRGSTGCRDGGALVVVTASGKFTAGPRGLGPELGTRHPAVSANVQEESWRGSDAAVSGVSAVWGWIEKLDGRRFRRLQLSAEISGVLGC